VWRRPIASLNYLLTSHVWRQDHGTIDMGGMLAVFKVRENLTSYADPGWY